MVQLKDLMMRMTLSMIVMMKSIMMELTMKLVMMKKVDDLPM